MRKVPVWFGVGAMAALLVVVAAVRADDKKAEKLTFDKAPKAVQDAVNGRFPGGKVTSMEKETENGKVVYDIELTHDGRKYEMDIEENGTVIEIEKEVKPVPTAVADAVQAKYAGATIKDVMEVNKVKGKEETPIHYEVTLSVGGKPKEVIVSLDGKKVEEEKK